MKTKLIATVFGILSVLAVSAPVSAAPACKGKTFKQCKAANKCSWVRGVKKNGKWVRRGYCRAK